MFFGGETVPRTGRPKSEDPRCKSVFIRLTKSEHEGIVSYAEKHDLSVTQTLVKGFNALKREEETSEARS